MLKHSPRQTRIGLFLIALTCASLVAVDAHAKGKAAGCYAGPKTLFSWNGCCEDDGAEPAEEEPIVTDRPDFTEASSTVGYGTVQLEMGYTFIEDTEAGTRLRSHSGPQALWRIGMFREWFELRIFQTWTEERTSAGGVRNTISGAEDLMIGAKIALTEQCGCLPEMAIIPQAFVPTGDGAFTNDEFMPGVNWVYSWDVTDHVSIAGSTQFNRTRDDAGEFYTEYAQSAALGLGLTDRLGAYSEWFAFFPSGADDGGARARHFFNGGFTYLLTNDIQYDIEAGVGLNDSADDYFVATGLSIRW